MQELLQSVNNITILRSLQTANTYHWTEIRFKEHGVDSIEVQDNGKGIDSSDWSGIGKSSWSEIITTLVRMTADDTF